MRRATSLIHTSEIKILLNLPSILIFVTVKALIMLMLFLEKARGRPTWSLRATWRPRHHVGDPCSRGYQRFCSGQTIDKEHEKIVKVQMMFQ